MNRTTRKKKASPDKAKEDKLKKETLQEEQLFKALPRDLQWEILSEYLGTHVVRNGKLMRRMTGDVQMQLLNSMPQMMPMKMRQSLKLNLKTAPMKLPNKNSWVKHFDTPSLYEKPGYRSLSLVEDGNGNPSYHYVSRIQGKDHVDIITPIDNSVVLQPFEPHQYPSYPLTAKKDKNQTRKNVVHYNPTKVSTGYRPRITVD
jgi:hypothetical protein